MIVARSHRWLWASVIAGVHSKVKIPVTYTVL